MALSIREAAREAGVSKSTILRAIQRGRLSAARDDDGNYQIDPAEVFRVYPPRTAAPGGPSGQDTPAAAPAEAAVMQAENEGLKAQLALLLDQVEDLRRQRDSWQADISRRLLVEQRPAANMNPTIPQRRGLLGWLWA